MAKIVTVNPAKETLTLPDLFQNLHFNNSGLSVDFDVLPSMVFFQVDSSAALKVDLGGLMFCAPSFNEFYANIDSGGKIIFSAFNQPSPLRFVQTGSGISTFSSTFAISQSGLYKMVWTENGSLLIQMVA